MSVPWEELGNSPQYTVNPQGSQATRHGRIDWSDFDDLVAEVFPVTIFAGGANLVGIGAPFPGRPYLRASNMTMEPETTRITGPFGTGDLQDFDKINQFATARVTVQYQTPKINIGNPDGDPVPLLSHRWSIGAETLTLPNKGLYWAIDNTAIDEKLNAGILIPKIEHQISWPHVLDPPFNGIRACMGGVNNAVFSFVTGNVAAETLLFLGAELERECLSDGSRAWTVTYRFSEKRLDYPKDQCLPGGWNHFWDPVRAGFYRMLIGQPSYQTSQYWIAKNSSGTDSIYKPGWSTASDCFESQYNLQIGKLFPGHGIIQSGPYPNLPVCWSTLFGGSTTTTPCPNNSEAQKNIFPLVDMNLLFPTD